MPRTIIYCLLVITSFSCHVAGRPAPNFTAFENKAFPNPLVIPFGNARYYCTNTLRWMTTGWNSSDCINAIQEFHDIEVAARRGTVYEFVEPGGRQRHAAYYGQETPREYTSGSCTMGIVSLNDRSIENSLPGMLSRKGAYAPTDFASYTDAWWAAIQLYQLCALNYHTPGWVPIGINSSTGVLLYPTNSPLDKQINGTYPTSDLAKHVPNRWTYYGCNLDNPDARALGNLSWTGTGLTVQRCADYCGRYSYMGLENGSECYCGDDLNSHAAAGGEDACDTPCNGGEVGEICGGNRSLSVYQGIGYGGINT